MLIKLKDKILENKRLWLLMPYFLISIAFIIFPIVLLMFNSFKSIDNFDNWSFVKKPTFWKILWRSIYIGFISSFIAILIAIPYSYFSARSKSKIWRIISITFAITPLFVFTLSKAFAIKGIITFVFGEANLISIVTVFFGLVYLNLPFAIMPFYSIFLIMPNTIIEASNDLGYSKFKTFFKIVIPYSYKAIVSTFVMVFLLTSTSIVVTSKILDNNQFFELIGNRIDKTTNASSETQIAITSTTSFITLIVLFIISSFFYLIPFYKKTFKKIKKLFSKGKIYENKN